MKYFEDLRIKGVKKTQRVIIRQGNERAGAHTHLSYNQTDMEVYSALNTVFQSGELKMETCESSHWVKKEAGLVCSCRPESRKEARPLPRELRQQRQALCRRPNRPETPGPHRTLGHSQASDTAYFGKMLAVLDLSFPIFEVEIL